MFDVTMLPANEGDCFLIRYGDAAAPRQVLIDVGRKATYKKLLKLMPEGQRHLDLFVISHVDRDHIEGALALLTDEAAGFSFDDIWFNGYRHLKWSPGYENFGPVQGEKVTTAILDRGLPWNKAFHGAPIRIEAAGPITVSLEHGLEFVLLSPDADKLAKLEPNWVKECRVAGMDPQAAEEVPAETEGWEMLGGTLEAAAAAHTDEDSAAPNGSSIAFLATFDRKTVLFGADAHPDRLLASLKKLTLEPYPITVMKVSHHGSQANTTQDLMKAVDCRHFLVSTNGSYFNHPNDAAIARLITGHGKGPRTLYFNYRQPKTTIWDESASQKRTYTYSCCYPDAADAPMTIDVTAIP